MLIIDIPAQDLPEREFFDPVNSEFITFPAIHTDAARLQLEHSLMSVRKWESIYHKSFMTAETLSDAEFLEYIRCMTINPQKNGNIYNVLSDYDKKRILEYMGDTKSAWVMKKQKKKEKRKKNEQFTCETVYYNMVQYGIPFECEKWHLNQLLALIDCFGENGSGGLTSPGGGQAKKMSEKAMLDMYRGLNEKNRKRFNSKG